MKSEKGVLSVIVVLFVVLSILAQTGGGAFTFSFQMEVSSSQDLNVQVDYKLSKSRFSKSVHILTFSAYEAREDPIYLFFDHPGVNGSYYPRVSGLYDHMRAKLRLYGYQGEIQLVERDALEGILEGPNATLILASEPANFTSLAPMALEWVGSGGVMIGIGNRSVPFVYDPRYDEGADGYLSLRYNTFDFAAGKGMIPSITAEAFAFEFVAPTMGIVVEDVISQGGSVLGYTYQRGELLTSVALFDIGRGKLLAMSGDMFFPILSSGEEACANDISKLLVSMYLWSTGDPFLESVDAGRESFSGTYLANLPMAPYIMVVAFNIDDFQDVFYREFVETGD